MPADYRKDTVYYLNQAVELLAELPDQLYRNNEHLHFTSGVGKHLRHVLDHYAALLNGLNTTINYDNRTRDPQLETDRSYALEYAKRISKEISELDHDMDSLSVESTPGTAEEEEVLVTTSTLQRELQFLTSHTIHHYALIALLLKLQGFEPPMEFGVAPSTLRYLATAGKTG
jgi:uncharacterized damage-inducible protein DinB